MNTCEIRQGDCLDLLRQMEDESINCCITSPPYWGLRDYGSQGQIGLELTPQEYVEKMRVVFSEIKRVLKNDGTLWLNLGDTYSAQRWAKKGETKTPSQPMNGMKDEWRAIAPQKESGLPDKNLVGIPWRVAFALQADGWYLRQDIIWHKPNPMPESVTDRCTKAHEYVFLLTKSASYYYDAEAIKEPIAESTKEWGGGKEGWGKSNPLHATAKGTHGPSLRGQGRCGESGSGMRNKRSVWRVTTKPFKGAHFATFPKELIEPCVLAGCPKDGTILDPFGGSGTTGQVAIENGRNAILLELNPEYVKLAEQRIKATQPPLFV